jgi:hypothetical protein
MSLWKQITGRWGNSAGATADIRIDGMTEHLVMLPQDHYEQHEGDHYFIKTQRIVSAADTVVYFAFTTEDSTKWAHARAKIAAEAGFTLQIYEGGTLNATAMGTHIPGVNNNRNSTQTSGLSAQAEPTVCAEGTLIWEAGVGSGRDAVAVTPELGYEIIAKQNTTYIWKITKIAAGSHYIDIDFFWYEHTSIH